MNYINGTINKCIVQIYACSWQATVAYYFEENRIKVYEAKYSYKVEMENVKSDKDMQLDYKINYFIDFEGNVFGKENQNRIDIFKEVKKTIPFSLKVM